MLSHELNQDVFTGANWSEVFASGPTEMQFTGLVMVRHKASSFSSWTQFKRHLHSRYESFQRASRLFQPQQISKKATGKEEEITSRSLEVLT